MAAKWPVPFPIPDDVLLHRRAVADIADIFDKDRGAVGHLCAPTESAACCSASSRTAMPRLFCRQRMVGVRSRPTEAVFSGLQGRSSPLVPTVALCKNSAGVGMAASPSPKLSQNVEKPINSGARVGRRCRGRAVFARGDGLVQQCSDFLASDAARSTGPAPSVAHFRRRCSKEFPFQGVKQHR